MISHAGLRRPPSTGGDYLYDPAGPSSPTASVALNCSELQQPELLDCDSIRTVNSHVRTLGSATTSKNVCKEILNSPQQPRDPRNIAPNGDLDLKASADSSHTGFTINPVSFEYIRRNPQPLKIRQWGPEAALSSRRNGVHGEINTFSSEDRVEDLATANLDLGDKIRKAGSVDDYTGSLEPTPLQSAHTAEESTFESTLRDDAMPAVDSSGVIAGDDLADSDSSLTSTTANIQPATVGNTQGLGTLHTQNALHYANTKRVPGTEIKMYISAPIPDEHLKRFSVLVEFFKQAVDNDSFLRHRTRDVNYELRICGKSPEDASPRIVVFCTGDLYDKLSTLLNSPEVKRQYHQKRRSILSSLPKKFSREPKLPPLKVHFKLVFWRESTTPTKQKSADELIKAQPHSYLTACGSLVTFEGRTATLAMLICVDSRLYGMTVDHIRRRQARETKGSETPKANDETPSLENLGDVSVDSTTEDALLSIEELGGCSDSDASDVSWDDDVEYGDLNINDSSSDDCRITHDCSLRDEIAVGGSKDPGLYVAGHFVDVSSSPSLSRPFLDWALIEFHDGAFERPNAFSTGGDTEEYKFLSEIAESPPLEHTPILMISGSTGTRNGVLLPGVSYIGGDPGQDFCEALVVDLSGSYGVIEGDCGSLVVNAVTLEVYGHVIACNPLGQAYVAPLKMTFHQITIDLGAEKTFLPNPVQGLTELSLHYLDNLDVDLATKVFSYTPLVVAGDHLKDCLSTLNSKFGDGNLKVAKAFFEVASMLLSKDRTNFRALATLFRIQFTM